MKMKKLSFVLLIVVALAATFVACSQPEATQEASGGEEAIHQGYSETAPQYEVDGVVVSNVDVEAILWNARGKTEEQKAARSKFLADSYDLKRTDAQKERAQQAREKYKDAVYVNSVMLGSIGMTNALEEHFVKGVRRNHEAGASAVSVTAYAFPSDGPMPLAERLERSTEALNGIDVKLVSRCRRHSSGEEERRDSRYL